MFIPPGELIHVRSYQSYRKRDIVDSFCVDEFALLCSAISSSVILDTVQARLVDQVTSSQPRIIINTVKKHRDIDPYIASITRLNFKFIPAKTRSPHLTIHTHSKQFPKARARNTRI